NDTQDLPWMQPSEQAAADGPSYLPADLRDTGSADQWGPFDPVPYSSPDQLGTYGTNWSSIWDATTDNSGSSSGSYDWTPTYIAGVGDRAAQSAAGGFTQDSSQWYNPYETNNQAFSYSDSSNYYGAYASGDYGGNSGSNDANYYYSSDYYGAYDNSSYSYDN